MNYETALVTGGLGFIGSHLVDGLLSAGKRVRSLDNRSADPPWELGAVDDMRADIRDYDNCLEATHGIDVVFHQAALGSVPRSLDRPHETIDVNVTGTATLLSACVQNGVKRVVYASSSSVYGPRSEAADDLELPAARREGELGGAPASPYGLSKRCMETIAESYARHFDLSLIGLRYFNVYGPRQRVGDEAAVVPAFLTAALKREPLPIHGDGQQTRDFTYVDDVVRANLLAAGRPPFERGPLGDHHAVLNVGAGKRTSILRLADGINQLAARPLDGPEATAFLLSRRGDVRHAVADVCLAEQWLGFRATTGVADGVEKTLDWFRAQLSAGSTGA